MERVETRHTTASSEGSASSANNSGGPKHGIANRQTTNSSLATALDGASPVEAFESVKKPTMLDKTKSFIAEQWAWYKVMWKQMFKACIAPTISLALYQDNGFSNYYTTLGYLTVVMTILSIVVMPRAKLLQTMTVSIFFACFGAALSLLAMYCCVQARNGDTATYNSSAAAVGALFLLIQIFMISVVRAKLPQYNIPCIMWAIFANVSMIYGPQFPTMALAESFTRRLLVGFLTGFAIGAGVSLLVFPLNSREVVFKGITGYIASLRAALKANLKYMHSLEREDMFAAATTNTIGEKPPKSPEATVFKEKVAGLAALHAKLSADLPFAKREIALGQLGPDDIQETFRILRLISIPTVGLSCMADIFVRVAEDIGWDRDVDLAGATPEDAHDDAEKMRIEAINEWHALMKRLRKPFGDITQTIDDGLEHVRIVLQLGEKTWKKSRNQKDEETEGGDPRPGDSKYAAFFNMKSLQFTDSKKIMLREWCGLHDIDLPQDFFEDPDRTDFDAPEWMREGMLSEPHRKLRRQLFLCLYMEFLLISIGRRTYKLIVAVDTFKAHGKLGKKRLVVPGYKRMRKWFTSLLKDNEDAHHDDDMGVDRSMAQVYLGDAYKNRKDPEHLPPANAWERFGNRLRGIPHFFQSPAAAFGLRAAAATMCIAIVGFLRPTQSFFTEQRIFWAQIMTSIAMSPSAGQSLQGFFFRAFGTLLALTGAWIAWYVVNGETTGVIVMFFVVMHIGAYIMLKMPQYVQVGVICQITIALIIGYELQVRELGIQRATSNGQLYYPIYELGPIRLATVCGGLFVGWIWTWFPYPITEHNLLRKQLGSSFYLLANYYSVMHETVRLRLQNQQGDMNHRDSPGRRLEKARNKLYAKANLTIAGLRNQARFVKYDIPIGGKFPTEQYQRLVNQLQSLLNFMSLVTVASNSFEELRQEGTEQHGLKWLQSFQKLVGEAKYTSEQVTTLLTLLSASITSEQALPPYLRVPEPYMLSRKLDEMDSNLLSVRHIAEPGYASFAVIQIGTRLIYEDLRSLLAGVKELVGELDFSYHIVSTQDSSRTESEETLVYTRSRRDHDSRAKQA